MGTYTPPNTNDIINSLNEIANKLDQIIKLLKKSEKVKP